jgi:hypothetical protein
MPSHEERALELVEFQDSLRALSEPVVTELQEAIAQALRTVELEAYERAAKVASEKSAMLPHQHDFVRGYANGRADAAQAIRALGKDSGS